MANLREKSLSRLWLKMQESDTGTITAYRSVYTKRENQQRNKKLLAQLMSRGYSVTSVSGAYIEDFGKPEAEEVTEHTFFVEDIKHKGTLEDDLVKFGVEYDQDSVMFIPIRGEISVLIGTNATGFPGFGKEVKYDNLVFGKNGEFMTKARNRPFLFESIEMEHQFPDGYLGRMAMAKIAKMNWSLID